MPGEVTRDEQEHKIDDRGQQNDDDEYEIFETIKWDHYEISKLYLPYIWCSILIARQVFFNLHHGFYHSKLFILYNHTNALNSNSKPNTIQCGQTRGRIERCCDWRTGCILEYSSREEVSFRRGEGEVCSWVSGNMWTSWPRLSSCRRGELRWRMCLPSRLCASWGALHSSQGLSLLSWRFLVQYRSLHRAGL